MFVCEGHSLLGLKPEIIGLNLQHHQVNNNNNNSNNEEEEDSLIEMYMLLPTKK